MVMLCTAAPSLVPVTIAQLDGTFWWMNGNLLKQVEVLRETKDVKAVVVSKVRLLLTHTFLAPKCLAHFLNAAGFTV